MRGRSASELATLVLGVLLWSAPASALRVEDIPDPRTTGDGWVTDMSGVLSPEAIDTLDAIASRLAERNGAQMAFVIVPETGEESAKTFVTALFQRWGVGRSGVDDGLLVLVVTGARRIEVETGYGLEGVLPDGRIGAILDRDVIPAFREGEWGGGLVGGARAFATAIVAGPEALKSFASETGTAGAAQDARSKGVLAWVLGLFAALGAGSVLVRTVRFCPKCRRTMRRFDERSDDAWLTVAERLEETLGSIDHRVWRCAPCGILTVEHARRLFSSFEDCPECKRRTVRVERVTLRPASTSREGLAEVTRRCQNVPCGFHDKRQEVLAKVVEAASGGSFGGGSSSGRSGGGSFGGGRSGGGGAGRSW